MFIKQLKASIIDGHEPYLFTVILSKRHRTNVHAYSTKLYYNYIVLKIRLVEVRDIISKITFKRWALQ